MTDQEIFDLIRADRKNFAILFDRYFVPIKKYIIRRVGDYDIACDITAESFLKAFLKVQQFEYRGISYKVWLYRIATNEMNLYFRSSRYHPQNKIDLENFNDVQLRTTIEAEKESWDAELKTNDDFRRVQQLIKELPEKYSSVLALRYFEKQSIKEIAQILNKPEGTIKSICSRGLEKIRNKMQPEKDK